MKLRLMITLSVLVFSVYAYAQTAHGDVIYRAKNVHAGNLVRVTFHNNGRLGAVSGDQSQAYTGEWPIGRGWVQMGNTSAYVMSEMRLENDSIVTPVVFCEGWDPNIFSHDSLARFQGFEPLPGYLNLSQKEIDPNHAVAMSNQAFTWPAFWPDKLEDKTDPGWRAHWNGYFGKDQQNADEESYYVMDDYQFNKRLKGFTLPSPVPDEPQRGGLGLKMSVRGLQWSNPDAQDCIFWLYDIKNFGELDLMKTVFGCNVGASSGGLLNQSGSDYDDDAAQFYRNYIFQGDTVNGLAVNYDIDNRGVGGYSPVPWVGFAFLESPGNPYDGIDNDGDGDASSRPNGGTGKVISEDDFFKSYRTGDQIILIDYESSSLKRSLSTMPAEGISFTTRGRTYKYVPNQPLFEIERDGIDNNLNGLIDENDGTMTQDSVKFYLYIRSQYNNHDYLAKNYFTGDTLNTLIDERRDDGIDNDYDWDPKFDDVGLDGKPATGDIGESDGIPTPGTDDLPGESNIDLVDVDESDQIGLTSFKFYRYSTLTYSNDDQMWEYSRPGYFDNKTSTRADYDYVFASGYFPLRPDQKEFFSVAMIYGWDEVDILRNKIVVQKIYNSNYNFAVAPTKPIVKAVAGDKKVTLYWDELAEESFDRFLRVYDFEGYKIYRATYQTFGDAGTITDGLGYERFKKPIAIYDKIDKVFGYFPEDFGNGILFNLGNETGLVHTYEDNDVINGVKYFYAVTAYDKGDIEKNIGPTECTIFVSVDQNGNLQTSENVITVTPEAPSAGYEAPFFEITPRMKGDAITSGYMGVNIINPDSLIDGDTYEVQFLDETMDGTDNDFDGKIDSEDNSELIPTRTTGFVLRNMSRTAEPDTIHIETYSLAQDSIVLLRDLYDDGDANPRTFSKVVKGMDIHIYNPLPGTIHAPELGIHQGIKWSEGLEYDSAYTIEYGIFKLGGFKDGTPYPRQYKLVFYNSIVDTSQPVGVRLATTNATRKLPVSPANFHVFDLQSGKKLKFGFIDGKSPDPGLTPAGFFSAKDRIVFYETLPNDSVIITTSLLNDSNEDSSFFKRYGRIMGEGDTLTLYSDLPYNGNTVFEFKVRGEKINTAIAAEDLSRIKVVPNPYIVTASWEPHNPYTSGRGPRAVKFIHLPQKCTIRIYTVDGILVRELEHDAIMRDGSETWDLLTRDNMDISYGIYIYHIDAPGIGEHVGRILVIK